MSDTIPIDTLPGAGFTDPFADALTDAESAVDGIPSDDYSAAIKPKLSAALTALGKVRAICWRSQDALISQFGATAALVQAQQEQAKASVPTWGYGPVTSGGGGRAAAQDAAHADVWTNAKATIAASVFAARNEEADNAANDFASKLGAASAAIELARKQWVGPVSLRPGCTKADADTVSTLEQEIRRSGLVWASEYLDAALTSGGEGDKDIHLFFDAALRVAQDVKAEPPIMTDRRFPSQGHAAAGAERDAAFAMWKRADAWLAENKPKSISVGGDVLTAITATAFDLCGPGNLGRLSAGQWETAILFPQQANKDLTKFQVQRGWLASWLAPRGSAPPGYSPIAGHTPRGLPYRFAAEAA